MRTPPLLLFAVASAGQVLLARRRRPTALSVGVAAIVATAAGGVAAGSALEFLRRRTTLNPVSVDRPAQLVTTGPNRLTRNPMYVGMAGILAAHALARRSVMACVPLAGFVWLIDRQQIPVEEAALAAAFGQEYAAYRARVPRWLRLA